MSAVKRVVAKPRELMKAKGWVRVEEACEAMGVSRRTMVYWVGKGEVESLKVGGTRWVRLPKGVR